MNYLRISSSLVPTGWSNDPSRLSTVPRKFIADQYILQGPLTPALASVPDQGATGYLISNFSNIYFWITDSDELLYMTEPYSVVIILRCMENDFSGLQTKLLRPLYEHSPPDQILWLSLWFWQVLKGWSQSFGDLDYIQEVVSGCYEYGLPLSDPLLLSDGSSSRCGTEFLLKPGDDFYLYYDVSSDLIHIDEPIALHDILLVISTERFVGLKTTSVNPLPEHGGPNVVADSQEHRQRG